MLDQRYIRLSKYMFATGIPVMRLGPYMKLNDCTYHAKPRVKPSSRNTELMTIRVLTPSMYSDRDITNVPVEREVSKSAVKLHALDENCVVIPDLVDYKGAYRYIPTSDVPTVVSRNSAYIRCPNILTALSLSLWLNSNRMISAIRDEFRRLGKMKVMDEAFIDAIVVPGKMLDPSVIGRALEIEEKILASHLEINKMVAELEDLKNAYT